MKRVLSLLFLLCLYSPAWGAPTFDAQSESTMFDAISFSWTHAVGVGCANSIVHVAVSHYDANNATLASVTVGGVAATQISTIAGGSGAERITTFRRVGAGTGNKTVEATFTGANSIAIGTARSYCDVDQTTPLGTAATDSSDGTVPAPTVNVTSATGELVIDSTLVLSTPSTATVGAGQTQRSNLTDFADSNFRQVESDEAGAAPNVTMSWGLEAAHPWLTIGVSLKPVGAAAAPRQRVVVVE